MRYGQIRNYDIANGPGIRTTIFVTGCTHHCKGCFNELYMDFDYGNLWTDIQTDLIVKCLQDRTVSGLTVLGGEPMQNADGLIPVLSKIRESIGWPEKKDSLEDEQALKPEQTSGFLQNPRPAHTQGFTQTPKSVASRKKERKTIWIYSGYTFEEILADEKKVELLSLCDVLVDGRFVEELKNPRLKFRGSENQRVINVRESLKMGKAVLMPGYELNPEHKIKFVIQKIKQNSERDSSILKKELL